MRATWSFPKSELLVRIRENPNAARCIQLYTLYTIIYADSICTTVAIHHSTSVSSTYHLNPGIFGGSLSFFFLTLGLPPNSPGTGWDMICENPKPWLELWLWP